MGYRVIGGRPVAVVGAAAVFALVSAGCGGSEDPADPTASASPSTSSSSATSSPSATASSSPTVSASAPQESQPTEEAPPTATSAAPTESTAGAQPPVSGQGFPEGVSYWTFSDNPGSPITFAAYGSRVGSSMCLIRIYPEYIVEVGTLTDTPAGQEFAVAERPATQLNDYVAPYTALVTGDPWVAVTLSASFGDLVLNAADMGTAASVIEQSNPGTDGLEVLSRVTAACG